MIYENMSVYTYMLCKGIFVKFQHYDFISHVDIWLQKWNLICINTEFCKYDRIYWFKRLNNPWRKKHQYRNICTQNELSFHNRLLYVGNDTVNSLFIRLPCFLCFCRRCDSAWWPRSLGKLRIYLYLPPQDVATVETYGGAGSHRFSSLPVSGSMMTSLFLAACKGSVHLYRSEVAPAAPLVMGLR